jgi:hypothetical protein
MGFSESTSFEKQAELLNEINPVEDNQVNKNPFFITAPAMVGLGLGTDNGNVDFYTKVGAGFSVLKMTETELRGPTIGNGDLESTLDVEFTVGGEVGLLVDNTFFFGVEYLHIQDARYKFELDGQETNRSVGLSVQVINIKAGLVLGK